MSKLKEPLRIFFLLLESFLICFACSSDFSLDLIFRLVMNYSASRRVCPQAVHLRKVTPVVLSDPIAIVHVSLTSLLHSEQWREQPERSFALSLLSPKRLFLCGFYWKRQFSFQGRASVAL